ncbi:MAG TPA: XRE family transcriptional regulator [Anaeromyxobacteraceae bacterium]|nr:XRE family transcriptional regulator [Anaeromyxobacteraceae bacterium]
MFNPSRLALARRRRGMTKIRLAKAIGLTPRSISGFETRSISPSSETIQALGLALGFPPDFFSGEDLVEPLKESASFRALTSMSAAERDTALAAGAIAFEVASWIGARFELPEPEIPDLRGSTPEAAAAALRSQWGLGELPVSNMIHLLESKGVRVFSLTQECKEVDAFSVWRGKVPFTFLNTMKSGERGRFDAAHELGHLTLHRHGGPGGRNAEIEADRFGAAFLMPEGSVLALGIRNPRVDQLVKLRKRWKVATIALTHRLNALGMITEWHYRHLCIEISRRGFRTSEPEGIPRETSQVLDKVFAALRQEGATKADVARELHLYPVDVEAVVFGLVISSIDGSGSGGSPTRRRPPNLRVV